MRLTAIRRHRSLKDSGSRQQCSLCRERRRRVKVSVLHSQSHNIIGNGVGELLLIANLVLFVFHNKLGFMAFCLSVVDICLSVHLYMTSAVRPSVRPPVRPSAVRPSVRLSVHPSVRPSARPSMRPSVDDICPSVTACLSIHPVRPPARSSVRPSVRPSVCRPSAVRPSVRPSVLDVCPSVRLAVVCCTPLAATSQSGTSQTGWRCVQRAATWRQTTSTYVHRRPELSHTL